MTYKTVALSPPFTLAEGVAKLGWDNLENMERIRQAEALTENS